MRRRRAGTLSTPSQLTDGQGQPITFATPGAPTMEERRRYAQAVQRATTPPPLTPDQQAAAARAAQQEREMQQQRAKDWQESQQRGWISTP